jgi:hypothetical protein
VGGQKINCAVFKKGKAVFKKILAKEKEERNKHSKEKEGKKEPC